MYPPDGLLTPADSKHDDVGQSPHIIASDPFASYDFFDVFSSPHPLLLTTSPEPIKMSTCDDEPLLGLNGRLRPRKSSVPSPQLTKTTRRTDSKTSQDKAKKTTPSKASPNKPVDLANKSDSSSSPQILCPYCDKKFGTKQALSKHTRRVHISLSKHDHTIACLYCTHAEADASGIIQHMVENHSSQYFACLDCHIRFSSMSLLAEHTLNDCEKRKQPYRNKLRQKRSSSLKKQKGPKEAGSVDFQKIDKEYEAGHSFNGVVISCELKPSNVQDGADIEDNITTNLILPPSKSLTNNMLEKNAVIVLDDIQWNKRIPPNFSFHNTDADQILSRLGVVHRAPRTGESTKLKAIDDSTQKFERCFDTSFYSKVASNVQENLSKFLDGSFNFNPDPENIINTRKLKNSVVINTAEGFPILLAHDQYSRNVVDGYMPRAIAPKHKWKWGNLEADRSLMNPDQIKRDSHTNNCIITLVSNLDIWTQLCMRRKFENKYNNLPVEKKTEQLNIIGKELKEILESREIPTSSSQLVKLPNKQAQSSEALDFPTSLGLSPSAPNYELQPAVLSGEWVRPRCYVCCACGAQTRDPRGLSSHINTQHPNAQVQHYEIAGELLLNADILKHLYVPPTQMGNRTRPLRGIRECTKCKQSITLEDLHQHMLDCAGDTPTVRRKCRSRPFGVRKRRTRLTDNTIRKKLRKDVIRNRQSRQKNHVRQRPRIRSEVGDAETIRKMLADLPAKRHRVTVNPLSSVLRPRLKRDKQRNKLMMMKRRPSEDFIHKNLRGPRVTNKTIQTDATSENTQNRKLIVDKDDDNKILKPKLRRIANASTSKNSCVQKKLNRPVRKTVRMKDQNKTAINVEESTEVSSVATEQSSIDNTTQRIDVQGEPYNTRQSADRSGSNNRDGERPSPSGSHDNSNNPVVPTQNVPLKHSIARLTANSETHDKSVQFHHLFLVQQECNNISQHVQSEQRRFFENEAVVTRLDKPPLHFQKLPSDSNELKKNKLNKPKKGLNDCIAMLKNKLVDPVPVSVSTEHISVQCGDDEPLYTNTPQKTAKSVTEVNSVAIIASSTHLPSVIDTIITNEKSPEVSIRQESSKEKSPVVHTSNQKFPTVPARPPVEKVTAKRKSTRSSAQSDIIEALPKKRPDITPQIDITLIKSVKVIPSKVAKEQQTTKGNLNKSEGYRRKLGLSIDRKHEDEKPIDKQMKISLVTQSKSQKACLQKEKKESPKMPSTANITDLTIIESNATCEKKEVSIKQSMINFSDQIGTNIHLQIEKNEVPKKQSLISFSDRIGTKSNPQILKNDALKKPSVINVSDHIGTKSNLQIKKNEVPQKQTTTNDQTSKKSVEKDVLKNPSKTSLSEPITAESNAQIEIIEILKKTANTNYTCQVETKNNTQIEEKDLPKKLSKTNFTDCIMTENNTQIDNKELSKKPSKTDFTDLIMTESNTQFDKEVPKNAAKNNFGDSNMTKSNTQLGKEVPKQPSISNFLDSAIIESNTQIDLSKPKEVNYSVSAQNKSPDLRQDPVPERRLSNELHPDILGHITTNIPPAHSSTSVKSILAAPLDLSGKMIGSSLNTDEYNYDNFQTLDLSSKSSVKSATMRNDTTAVMDVDVVDLSVKPPQILLERRSNIPVPTVSIDDNIIESITDLSINKIDECNIPTDLSVRTNENREIDLSVKKTSRAMTSQSLSVYKSKLNYSVPSSSEVLTAKEMPTDLSKIRHSDKRISSIDADETFNSEDCEPCDYNISPIYVDNPTDLSEKGNKQKDHDPENKGILEAHGSKPKYSNEARKVFQNISYRSRSADRYAYQKPVYDPTLKIPQYKIRAPASSTVTSGKAVISPSLMPQIGNTTDTTSISHLCQKKNSYPYVKITTASGDIPMYTFQNSSITHSNKIESTTPVYTLSNACISITKIDTSTSSSLTNTLLSIPGMSITNTTSVYTLAGSTISAPVNYGAIPSTGTPAVVPDSYLTITPIANSKSSNLNDSLTTNTETKNEKEVGREDVASKDINQDDPEIAKKIAMLPKELVEILGTMPLDHRKQLLDVLPQYVSTSTTSTCTTSNATVQGESSNIKDSYELMSTVQKPKKTADLLLTGETQNISQKNMNTTYQTLHEKSKTYEIPLQTTDDSNMKQVSSCGLSISSKFPVALETQDVPDITHKIDHESKKNTISEIDTDCSEEIMKDSFSDCIAKSPNYKNDDKDLNIHVDKIIDLTDDEVVPLIDMETVSKDTPSFVFEPSLDKTKPTTLVKSNMPSASSDKTASLRAVRIKAPSERNKSVTQEKDNSLLDPSPVEQQVSLNTTKENQEDNEANKSADTIKSLAIQQAEVSSTQHSKNNVIGRKSSVETSTSEHESSAEDSNNTKPLRPLPFKENTNTNPTAKRGFVTSSTSAKNKLNVSETESDKSATGENVQNTLNVSNLSSEVASENFSYTRSPVKQPELCVYLKSSTPKKDINLENRGSDLTESPPILSAYSENTIDNIEEDSEDDISLAVMVKQKQNDRLRLGDEHDENTLIKMPEKNKLISKKKKKTKKVKGLRDKIGLSEENSIQTSKIQNIENVEESKSSNKINCDQSSNKYVKVSCESLMILTEKKTKKNTRKSFHNVNITDMKAIVKKDSPCHIIASNMDSNIVSNCDGDSQNNVILPDVSEKDSDKEIKKLEVLNSNEDASRVWENETGSQNKGLSQQITFNENTVVKNVLFDESKDLVEEQEFKLETDKDQHLDTEKNVNSTLLNITKSLRAPLSESQDTIASLPFNTNSEDFDSDYSLEPIRSKRPLRTKKSRNLDAKVSVASHVSIRLDEENISKPLRRSRRVKSLFVESNCTEHVNSSDSTVEYKTPIPKKQVIFTKLMLDEENKIPSHPISETKCASDDDDDLKEISSDFTSALSDVDSTHSVTKNKKRKNMSLSKQKSKKKKCNVVEQSEKAELECFVNLLDTISTEKRLVPPDNYSEIDNSIPPKENTAVTIEENVSVIKDVSDSIDLDNSCDGRNTVKVSAEKRKIDNFTLSLDTLATKSKKSKLDNKNLLESDKNKNVFESDKLEDFKNESRTTTCYNMHAARRTRSKSVVVQSSAVEMYDPYDINFDEMIEAAEPYSKKRVILKENSNNNYQPQSNTTEIKIVQGSTTSSIDTDLKEAKTISQNAHLNVECTGIISDSDESSKSDIPLQKYVEEKEKKMNKLEDNIPINEKETDEDQDIEDSEHLYEKQSPKRNKKSRRTLAICNNVDSVTDANDTVQNESEEQLRSEQFMESFGFFSERKPRKSNLLATKKISETFHIIANESDDIYFGFKDRVPKKPSQNENRKSLDSVPDTKVSDNINCKKSGKRGRKKKCSTKTTPCYCLICKKEFRRPDNFLRHQMTLLHISKLSEVEMKIKTAPVHEEPNYLIAYKQQLDRLKILTNKLAKQKKKSKSAPKIILPTIEEILADVNKTVREQQLSQRGLSRDEALFLDCCELLKESHKNEVPNADTTGIKNISNPSSSTQDMDLIEKIMSNEKCDSKSDGDVDSITAKNILESEEVRNLENDLISGLKEAANASSLNTKNIGYQNESHLKMTEEDNLLDNLSRPNINDSHFNQDEELEITHGTNPRKSKKHIEIKEKMYPDIENIDMFEDKFDKIKRKCRSQAAAAKLVSTVVEPSTSHKGRRKSDKKKGKKSSKKSLHNMVLTKGALKGFDGIRVSIPTSDINMAAIVPSLENSVKKKKKSSSKKKSEKRDSESSSKYYDSDHRTKESYGSHKKVDVYEFMDTEDAELFEFRPSTLMERFKSLSNKELPSTSKVDFATDDADENTSASASDGDDFVYMSDDYVASDDETENSLMSFEMGGAGKVGVDSKKSPLKRKDVVEKNAVMGKIFKNNAVRSEKKVSKPKEPKETANFDQLFDSLLEEEPGTNNETASSPIKDICPSLSIQYDALSPKTSDSLSPKREEPAKKHKSRTKSSSPTMSSKYTNSPKDFEFSPPKNYESLSSKKFDADSIHDLTSASYESDTDYGASTPKKNDTSLSKDIVPLSPEKCLEKNNESDDYVFASPKYGKSPKTDRRGSLDKSTSKTKLFEDRSPSKKEDDSATGYDCSIEAFDQGSGLDDTGVARQRARRKCTVGKQNVLTETWSSESEPDGVPARPNSAESVVMANGRRKKGRKREGQHTSGRRGNRHISFKKHDFESRVNSNNRHTSSGCASGGSFGMSRSGGGGSAGSSGSSGGGGGKVVMPCMLPAPALPAPAPASAPALAPAQAPTAGPSGVAAPKGRARSAAYYNWSSEGDDEQEHLQQHGWIVGDSHKKLVTMLAHAKGRKRNNNDEKRHLVE